MTSKTAVNRHQVDSFHHPIAGCVSAKHQLDHNITIYHSSLIHNLSKRKRDDCILRNLQRQVTSPKPGSPSFSSFSSQVSICLNLAGIIESLTKPINHSQSWSISRPKLPKPKSTKIQSSAYLSTSASSHALIGLHAPVSQTQNFHHRSLTSTPSRSLHTGWTTSFAKNINLLEWS